MNYAGSLLNIKFLQLKEHFIFAGRSGEMPQPAPVKLSIVIDLHYLCFVRKA